MTGVAAVAVLALASLQEGKPALNTATTPATTKGDETSKHIRIHRSRHIGCGGGDDSDWGSGGEKGWGRAERGDGDDDSSGGSGGSGGGGGDGEECGGSDSEREGSGEGREGSGSSSGGRGGSPGGDSNRFTSEGEDASDALMGGASESRDLDGEPQPYHAARGDASDVTSDDPESRCDAADISRKRAPGGDEHGRAAKTRRQEGGRRTYGRGDIDGGDNGSLSEPICDDEGGGSTDTYGRAAGDGSNKHGDAHANNDARDDSSGRAGNGNGVGGVESDRGGTDSEDEDASGGHIARTSEDKDHDTGASIQGAPPAQAR